MPIYEYRCKNGHTFEVLQRMDHEPVEVCEVCGDPVERVFHPVAVHFKGSGFYSTDYGRKGSGGGGGSDSDSGSKDESKKESSSSKSESSSSSSESSSSSSSDSSSSSSADSKSD